MHRYQIYFLDNIMSVFINLLLSNVITSKLVSLFLVWDIFSIVLYFCFISEDFLLWNFDRYRALPSNAFVVQKYTQFIQQTLSLENLSNCTIEKMCLRNIFILHCISNNSNKSNRNKRPMGHIAHLRKQFKSINTYDYIIMLI